VSITAAGALAAPATAPSLPPPLGAGAARGAARGASTRVRRLEKEAAREEADVAREEAEAEAEAEEKEAKEGERVEEAEAARDPPSESVPTSESGLPWDNLPSGLSRSAASPRWLQPLSSSGLTMWAAICR
jgi:hypothetical protein